MNFPKVKHLLRDYQLELPACPWCFKVFSSGSGSECDCEVLEHECLDCGALFPNERYCEIHVREVHDPFFSIQKERGQPVYQCIVCNLPFHSEEERNKHCLGVRGEMVQELIKNGWKSTVVNTQ